MECKLCGEDADELFVVKVKGKAVKGCEDCTDRLKEANEIEGEALGAMKNMMGYKGKF